MSVGCSRTSVCRSLSKSEYLRRTSRSLCHVSSEQAMPEMSAHAHSCSYGIRSVLATAFRVPPSLSDDNLKIGILIQNLLYSAVIPSFPRLDVLAAVNINVTQRLLVTRMRYEFG